MLLLCVWLKLLGCLFVPKFQISFSRKPRPPQCSLASLTRVPKVTPSKKILDPPMSFSESDTELWICVVSFTTFQFVKNFRDLFAFVTVTYCSLLLMKSTPWTYLKVNALQCNNMRLHHRCTAVTTYTSVSHQRYRQLQLTTGSSSRHNT